MPETTVRLSGPVFDAVIRSSRAHEFVQRVADRIAGHNLERVQAHLNTSIKHPTPYYETQVHITSNGFTDRSVNDRGVVYGPWLEGVSARNQSTRFKGYASFRRATDETRKALRGIMDEEAQRFAASMNGGR